MNFVDNIFTTPKVVDLTDRNVLAAAFIDIGLTNFCVRVSTYNRSNKKITTFHQENYHCKNSFKDLSLVLGELKPVFEVLDFVVVESQVAKIAERNVRIMYYVFGALQQLVPDICIVCIRSQAKTKLLDAPKGMKGKEHKDWCYEKAMKILDLSKDNSEYDAELIIRMSKMKKSGLNKRDDHGDVVCYCYVWWTMICEEFISS